MCGDSSNSSLYSDSLSQHRDENAVFLHGSRLNVELPMYDVKIMMKLHAECHQKPERYVWLAIVLDLQVDSY